MAVELLVVAVCLAVNAFLAGSEIALISLREGQLARAEQRGDQGRRLALLARDPTRFLTTIQIGITLAGFVASASVARDVADRLESPLDFLGGAASPIAFIVVLLLLTYLSLVFGELAPKRLAMQRAERWALFAAPILAALGAIARPAVWLLGRSADLMVRLLGGNPDARAEDVTEDEVRDLIATQIVRPDQRRILASAFDVAERTLREIVVPWNQVVSLQADTPADESLELLKKSGHTRAPVYGADQDDIRGELHLIDLLGADGPVGDHVRPAVFLPETSGVLDALRRMQGERRQMAVVLNEHGGTEGIVTLEDLLEEIVGDLYDEFDRDLEGVERQEGDVLLLPGDYPVHDLPDLGISLPEGPYTTVAGYVLDRLGSLASGGEVVEADGWRTEVLEIDRRAIRKVRLSPGRRDEDGEENGERP